MKNISTGIIALLLLVSLSHCSSTKIATYPAITEALPNAEEGTLLVRSSGEGQSRLDAVDLAEKKAFNALLFYGFPSSSQSRPLIENEATSRKANPGFFDDFLDNKGYKNYILSSVDEGSDKRVGKYFYLNRVIKINIRSLRTNLENKGIIRKFGY